MSSNVPDTHVLVLGAGLSGLLAARDLQASGLRVRVLDKARGVGGRLATRRIDASSADHGAQFFTAHAAEFRRHVEDWVARGVARRWSTGFRIPDGTLRDNGVPRYCGVGGMTAIAKHLAEGLDLRLSSRVVRVNRGEAGWTATLEDGSSHAGHALLLTAPVPQSLALLAAGEVVLPEAAREALEPIDYSRTLTLLARLAGPSAIPEPGGLWMEGEPLFWMGDNRLKGLSSDSGTLVTLHAGQDFSLEHWDRPEAETTSALLEAARRWLGSDVVQTQLHRWRYSVPLRVHPEPCLVVGGVPPLVFAGDAFGGPRIEAAALSGLAAAAALGPLVTR